MVRTDYAAIQNSSSQTYDLNASSALLTINSTLVTAGVRVTDAFSGKQGSLMLGVLNTAGSAKTMYVRPGGYDADISGQEGFNGASGQGKDYTIPAGTAPYIVRIDLYETDVRCQNNALLVDFASGLTGSFFAINEAGHLAVGVTEL